MNRNEFIKAGLAFVTTLGGVLLAQQERRVSFIVESRCVGCGDCIRACPVKAITLRRGKAFIDSEKCIGCRLCIMNCSYGAPK